MSEPSMFGPPAPELPKAEAPKVEAKAEASAQAAQPEVAADKVSPIPGKVIVMSRGDRAWADHGIDAEARAGRAPKRLRQAPDRGARRRGGAGDCGRCAGWRVRHRDLHAWSAATSPRIAAPTSLEASLSRIDADIQALKTGLDHTAKLGMSQFNKTSERLDKLERAQAEPAAKIAKLSETVDKLRATPPRGCGRRCRIFCREGNHRFDRASPASHGNAGWVQSRRQNRREDRSRPVADAGRLGAARCRLWRRLDRRSPRHLRSLCRRHGSGPWPG